MTTCARCHRMLDGEDETGWYYEQSVSDMHGTPESTYIDRVHNCGDGNPHVAKTYQPDPTFRAWAWAIGWLAWLQYRWRRLRGRPADSTLQPGGPPEHAVFLPQGQEMDGPLRRAIADALPDGTTLAFSSDTGERTWVHVICPGDSSDPGRTREVLNTALASLNRPTLDS